MIHVKHKNSPNNSLTLCWLQLSFIGHYMFQLIDFFGELLCLTGIIMEIYVLYKHAKIINNSS
jgi:hypothetical protein